MDDELKKEIQGLIRDEIRRAPNRSLPIPLDIDTTFALKTGGFILHGSATLASGSATVSDHRIKPNSVPIVSYKTHSNQGTLRAACTDKTLTITSTSGTDDSDVHYLIVL